MASPAKAILAGTAVVGVGGTGIWMVYSGVMPEWRPLVKDSEFLDASGATKQPKDEFAGKYGAKYARFLVGTGAVVDTAKPKSNENGWTWSFQNNYKSKDSMGFKDLTQGPKPSTSDANIKSLQEACDKAYKAEVSKVKAKTSTDDEFDEKQLGMLCSPLRYKPSTVKDRDDSQETNDKDKAQLADGGGGKNGSGSTRKEDLLAIYYEGNAKAGDELNRQFQNEKPDSEFFKGNNDGENNIKSKCEGAYKKELDTTGKDASKPAEDDLYKGCSIQGYKKSSASGK